MELPLKSLESQVVLRFVLVTEITMCSQDLVALGDSDAVPVQAAVSEGEAASRDLKTSSKAVGGHSPRLIEIGSDMSQIESQLNDYAETEESGGSKVRIFRGSYLK